MFIRALLENVGADIDPMLLIKRIRNGMEIPGLKDALIKILQDFSLQVRSTGALLLLPRLIPLAIPRSPYWRVARRSSTRTAMSILFDFMGELPTASSDTPHCQPRCVHRFLLPSAERHRH